MEFKPTDAQKKIYEFIEHGTGNGIIDAVAGAGKTTTLMECVRHIPNIDDVVYCAFNKSIQKEIKKKFSEANLKVNVGTIHSLGYQLLKERGIFKLNDRKYDEIIKNPEFFETLIPEIDTILRLHDFVSVAELREMEERRDSLDWEEKNQLNEAQQFVHLILKRLLEINQKYRCTLEEDSVERYMAMIAHFGIIPVWASDSPEFRAEVECYFKAHHKLLKEGNSMAISHSIIDFTDQLYLPYKLNLTSKHKYGFVFVDECQDLSKAQVNIVRQYLREDGRLLAVGDPYQAIYGFAGADCESFERVRTSFNCRVLGLTDCFRCPADVIKIAQSIREDIKGFKKEPGKIYSIHQYQVIFNIKPGDLVICRTRKPLMALALQLITKDFKVKIHPDELQEFMGDYKKNFTPQELRKVLREESIDSFFEQVSQRNAKRIARENQNADPVIRKMIIKEEVDIMQGTLDFLKKKFFEWHLNTLDAILTKLKRTLSSPSKDAIRISTIHRAKGLENDRVFIIEYNKLPRPRDLEWENIQERNLHYVAVTRPKEELYLCDDVLQCDGDPEEDAKPAKPVNVSVSWQPKAQPAVEQVQPSNDALAETEEPVKNDLFDRMRDLFGDFEVVEPSASQEDEVAPDSHEEPEPAEPTNPIIDQIPSWLKDAMDSTPVNTASKTGDGFPSWLQDVGAPKSRGVKFHDTTKFSKVPTKFYSLEKPEETPYPGLNQRDCQMAKYWSMLKHLEGTEFSISDIVCSQYLDAYFINTPDGVEVYNAYYKASGQFNVSPKGYCKNAEKILPFFENESNYSINCECNPSVKGFGEDDSFIRETCKELGITITNIFQDNYSFFYCMKTLKSHAYLKMYFNGRNMITSVFPYSTLGDDDEALNSLVAKLKESWQG